jgi:dTDP-4-amino-4,6-dideoxygalactose transaminase
MINVVKTYLPPLREYVGYLQKIWETRQVTNDGEFEKKLIKKLKKYLGVDNLVYVANGTMALQLSIRALGLEGEVVTTPYSYVATTSSLVWEKCRPVFVDIEPDTLCIDSARIEKAITKKTSAILTTHVYGNPCDVEAINKIAKAHKLKVVYDAAHAFGVKYNGAGIGTFGDISIFSFHATKAFHSVQGGAVVSRTKRIQKKVDYMRRFGHKTPTSFHGLGINARNSEFHAALGLCLIKRVSDIIKKTKQLSISYDKNLKCAAVIKPVIREGTLYNYSYYPVIFESKRAMLKTKKALENKKIYPRRYFYPSLDTLSYVNSKKMTISRNISKRVLCLPLYYELTFPEIDKISKVVRDVA